MPKFPIYGPILFDKGEICPHNKIAKTIKRVYHRDPPIRLKDVCQMRKLGDHRFHLESECNNSNYLWHVTLNTGNNPYVSVKPKNGSSVNKAGAWNFHNLVIDKMRNGFRRYRTQTSAQKPCDKSAVEWIMKPRELAYDSSQEDYMWTHPNRIKQSTLPVSSNCKKRTLFIEAGTRRAKYSLSAHFEEALAKSKKNLENEKRRTDKERVKDGEEKLNTQVLRKAVIVKKKLADTWKKGVNLQQSVQQMNVALKKKQQALKATKYIGDAQKIGRALQYQSQKHMSIPPVSPSTPKAPKLELSRATSQTGGLRKIHFRDFTQKLSDISIWCPRKSSFKCFENLKQSSEFGKTLSAEKGDARMAILRRLTQAFKSPTKFTPASKVDEPSAMQSAPNALLREPNKGEERVSKATRVGVGIGKKKSFRHHRTFRRRVKQRWHVKGKPTMKQQHEHRAVQCINTKSSSNTLSSSSGSSVLLSGSNKDVGAWLGSHEKELRLAHESSLLQKPGIITPKETEKSDSNNPCSDYTISFHTPITLRQLIQRNRRVQRSKGAQNSKLV